MRGNMERGSNHTHQVSCPQHNPLGLNNPPQFQPQLHAPNHQFAVPMVTPFDNRNTHFSNFHGNNLAMLNRPPPHLVQPHGQFFSHNAQQNMSPVMSFPSHQQFCNVPQNLNQMVPPQVNGQFFLQNQGPNFNQIMSNGCSHMQNFSQNMPLQPRGQFCSNQMSQNLNQVMGMLHGQTFSQNIMANLNQIMPMQCSQLPINPPMFIPSSMGQNAMQESPIVAQHMQGTHCPVQMHQNQKNLQTVGKQQSQGNHYVSGKRESPHMRFQKSQSHHLANAKGSFKHVSKNGGKGGNSWRSGEFHLERSSGEVVAESQRSQKSSLPFNYTEEGIQQWREQRKKHYPTKTTVAKLTERRRNNELIDADAKMRRKGLLLRIVGVCDSQSLLVATNVFTMELNDEFLMEICQKKSSGSSLTTLSDFGECQTFKNAEAIQKVIDIAALLGRSTGLSLVDCSASSETIKVLNRVVDLGCCIVLANKKPLTSGIEDYENLVSHLRRIRYESTVGAGLPVITSLTRIIASGDSIDRVIGSLSGTLGYVMSELEDGKPFSLIVRAAKSLGYTEPDPRDDLSGMDVARKALILVRLLGWRINLDDIKVDSLYPDEMGPNTMSIEDFLDNGLPTLDKEIEERIRVASSNGNVLRYVCMIEGSRCQVGLKELPKNSPLGRLRGSDNVVEVYSRCYKDLPLVIQGAGAGNDTTAAGVLADIIDLQDLFT
ncbi:glyceraldehyde-3-phosphate dehydrogenase-like family protein isoform X2 [Tasmannia lanceolata]|uniref:glyceraldehyde-3-phosphate dehydrogenase-like family protein isoform X2 n=1 Tax=Tasmannia lanceolata TaxID=3420 RepID=UPI0040636FEE